MGLPLKRDMDFVRDLMLEIEGGKRSFQLIDDNMASSLGIDVAEPMTREQVHKYETHLTMLVDAEFIRLRRSSGGTWYVEEVTWAGHDFISSVRDSGIWQKTKAGARQAGGFTASLLADLAKGYVKAEIAKHTGMTL